MFKHVTALAGLTFVLMGHAEPADRNLLRPPIMITRFPGAPTQVLFRSGGRIPRWLVIDGRYDRSDVRLTSADFSPEDGLSLNLVVRDAFRSVRVPTPGALDVGFDGDHLILFTMTPAGFDETVMIKQVRLVAPKILNPLAQSIAAYGVALASLGVPQWSWSATAVVGVAAAIVRDGCQRWLNPRWSGALAVGPHEIEYSDVEAVR